MEAVQGIMQAIAEARLVPAVRARTQDQARRVALALIEAGFRIVEVSLTVPDAPELVEELANGAPEGVLVGVGSVTNAAQARLALGAGARFLVSPIRQLDLVRVCHQVSVPCILGALTATEIVEAHRAGADQIKVFPVGLVGGPRYLQQILGVLHGLSLMASGGVTLANFREYLAAGASTVVLGSDLLNPAWVEAGDWEAIVRRSREYLGELEGAT